MGGVTGATGGVTGVTGGVTGATGGGVGLGGAGLGGRGGGVTTPTPPGAKLGRCLRKNRSFGALSRMK
ncbi:hypothetical protein D0962_01325 [Leptolyngbyaceae cyanobacterium CCMR0082]|uniref:Uncharacterized protein n=1 Tax=Adonisia turfae CCMR0082 TaxID=2304604 RepID=A0A6M0RYY5_9CYAN|nr:hypothetical protein [Adonisia turfae CCMR0082]